MATDTDEGTTGTGASTKERPLRSVEDMAREKEQAAANGATDEETDEETDGTPQLVLEGLGSRLNNNIGGKHANESVFKTRAVSLPIAGGVQLAKDTEVWVAIPFAIDDVRIANRRRSREIVGVVRTHTAFPIGQPIILDGPPVEADGHPT